MPRMPRQQAESGFYHVICRGSGRQLLFEDDGDRRFFLNLLATKTGEQGIVLLAWCLMSNHVHVLMEDEKRGLSVAMHGLATGYARYFNRKTGHVGPVFQDRFASVPVESDRQLLQAVRYIHDNPAKAGVARVDSYPWSSYGEYLTGARIISDGMVLEMVGGRSGFRRFSRDELYAAYYPRISRRVPDRDALQAARSALPSLKLSEVKALPRPRRDKALRTLRSAGITVRQIERLTGIGRSTITRATS